MALPMVHLAVAYNWPRAKNSELIGDPEYFLGVLSPDAIHARPGSTRDDKRRTHLRVNRYNFAAVIKQLWARDPSPFAIGYGFHILTDRVWIEYYKRRCPELLDAAGHVRAERYYNDADQVDFQLYGSLPYRKTIWDLLERSCPHDFSDASGAALSAGEIRWWRDRTLNWYASGKSSYSGPVTSLTPAVIGDFIAEAPGDIDAALAASEDGQKL